MGIFDMLKNPALLELIKDQRVKGVKGCDFLTIKELSFRDGEMVGRLGLIL